jgi:hypothetical protein
MLRPFSVCLILYSVIAVLVFPLHKTNRKAETAFQQARMGLLGKPMVPGVHSGTNLEVQDILLLQSSVRIEKF